jgi:hypothetical protein
VSILLLSIFTRAAENIPGGAVSAGIGGHDRVKNSGAIHQAGLPYSDRSVTFLLLTNLVTVVWAVLQQWNVTDLLWIYWGQSVIIGYYNVHRIVDLDQFSTDGLLFNNRPVEPTRETQRRTAVCFALHYGLFHLGYGVFLLTTFRIQAGFPLAGVLLCLLAFYFNHRYSYRYNRERDRVPNVGTLMFFPYVRIIPMQLMILLGSRYAGDNTAALVLFLLLKTAADVATHVIEHAMASAGARRASGRLPVNR